MFGKTFETLIKRVYIVLCAGVLLHLAFSDIYFRTVSTSNCSKGQMRSTNVTRGPYYDADATTAVPQPY